MQVWFSAEANDDRQLARGVCFAIKGHELLIFAPVDSDFTHANRTIRDLRDQKDSIRPVRAT
jgi:hypothetical protein